MVHFAGNVFENKPPPSSRTVSEIISSIQRSKIGVQDWSLSDLTLGLYLLYLRQASTEPFQEVKGVQISCDSTVITNTLKQNKQLPTPNFHPFTVYFFERSFECVFNFLNGRVYNLFFSRLRILYITLNLLKGPIRIVLQPLQKTACFERAIY